MHEYADKEEAALTMGRRVSSLDKIRAELRVRDELVLASIGVCFLPPSLNTRGSPAHVDVSRFVPFAGRMPGQLLQAIVLHCAAPC